MTAIHHQQSQHNKPIVILYIDNGLNRLKMQIIIIE